MGPPKEVLTPATLQDLYAAPPQYYQHVHDTEPQADALPIAPERINGERSVLLFVLALCFALAAGLVGCIALMKRMLLAAM